MHLFGLGTLTPRARGPKNRVPGSIQLRQWKAFPGLVVAAGFAGFLNLQRVMEMNRAKSDKIFPCW